ncbi:MAG TPA: hypothetical protein VHH32_06215 [Gemmatimonadales bacterium]|nr:hypothetical protein [Gemmatimonadales bacterium]
MSTVDASIDRVSLGDVVIVGGGCYGTFYAEQLMRAAERGKAEYRRLLIVDRDRRCKAAQELGTDDTCRFIVQDWSDFFDQFLAKAEPSSPDRPDAIVPSPLMPHLMYEWLVRQARKRWPARPVETRPVSAAIGTPYDVAAPDGTRFVSYADWTCPTHCIEPATCPVIRAPRTWEMADAMAGLTRRLDRLNPTTGPVLFICQHRVFGVGMFDVSAVLAGDATVASAGSSGSPIDVVVGTISSCHGAVNLLHLGSVVASP